MALTGLTPNTASSDLLARAGWQSGKTAQVLEKPEPGGPAPRLALGWDPADLAHWEDLTVGRVRGASEAE